MSEHVHELLHVSAATLFFVAGVGALIDHRSLRERAVLEYALMCLASGAYAGHVALSHNLPKLGEFWIPWTLVGLSATFLAALFYLATMGQYLGIKTRFYRVPLAIQGSIAAFALFDLVAFGVLGRSLLFLPVPRGVVGEHQRELGEAAYSLLPAAEVVAALFMLSFVLGTFLILVRLIKTRSTDILLYLGLGSSMAFIVNDTLVAMSIYDGVYLLAFSKAFETIRIRRDIRLRAGEHIEQRLRQAEKMQAIGRVTGGIAHDFGNLLTVIGGSVELASGGLPDDHPVRSDLLTAEEGVSRGRFLVGQLLDVARSRETEAEQVDLEQFLSESANLLRGLLPETTRLKLEVGPEAGHVRIPPGQLTQVLINLVVNARDAMPHGGTIFIRASGLLDRTRLSHSSAHPSFVQISVTDEGVGIPSDVVEHIFEPLFTTKAEKGGSGLGLATLYSIVHRAGGTIEVESHSGQGTRFDIILPRLVG